MVLFEESYTKSIDSNAFVNDPNHTTAGGCKLGRVLGIGGMAAVFEANHIASNETVAVKLLRRQLGERERDSFRNEVRAVAQLDHPGIIGVLDAGELEHPITYGTRSFATGTPFLVMEHADGGVFSPRNGIDSWEGVRRVVLEVLDALAHAHALGIVHRDIKPGNLLVHNDRCVLSDFGIVRLADHAAAEKRRRILGTPAYMSPEQIRGEVLSQGPWTDLYSVGVLAWDMVVGHRPFEGTQDEMLSAHLNDPLPPLAPRFPVPDGLDRWLQTMLAKSPRARFQRASDAAHALLTLAEPDQTVEPTSVDRGPQEIFATETLLITESPTVDSGEWVPNAEPVADASAEWVAMPAPAVPRTWQRPESRGRRGLANAGLGLFGLRSIPLIDREAERDVMWGALRTAAHQSSPRCVVLRGESGVGKSRLAEWLVRRAHELGCAEVVRASQTEQDGPSSGLRILLTRFFDAGGLEGEAIRERVDECLRHHRYSAPFDAETFSDVVSRKSPQSSQPFLVENDLDTQHFAAVARLFTHLSRARPVVVWLDDLRPEGDLDRFVAASLQGAVAGPVLFVLTARSADDPLLKELEPDDVTYIDVPPLSPTYVRSLAAKTMGLEPSLSQTVAAHAGGIPLAAIQMIADWVERDDLVVGPEGYRLRADSGRTAQTGEHALSDIWMARLERAYEIAGFARDRGHHAMTVGSLLGRRFSFEVWSTATAFREPELRQLANALFSAGLAIPSSDGILLAFDQLHKALLAAQSDPATRRRNHLACAYALRRPQGDDDEAIRLQQVAYHLAEGGEREDALPALIDAMELFARRFETRRAGELIEAGKDLLDALDYPEDSPESLRVRLVRVTILYLEKGFDEAQSLALSCLVHARSKGLRQLEARSMLAISHAMFKASVSSMNEHRDEAVEYGERASELFLELGDEDGAMRAQLACAYAHLQAGRADKAAEAARLAADYTSADSLGSALAHYLLGTVERARGNDDIALTEYQKAIEVSRAGGVRLLLAGSYNGLGDILRFRGENAEALRAYEDAVLLWENLGSSNVNTARINASLANIAMGDYAAARATLESILEASSGTDAGYESAFATIFLLPCLAAAEDVAEYDACWERATDALTQLGIADRDIELTFDLVASLWRERGDADRADAAAEIAARQNTLAGPVS